jgi:hypothetical protein
MAAIADLSPLLSEHMQEATEALFWDKDCTAVLAMMDAKASNFEGFGRGLPVPITSRGGQAISPVWSEGDSIAKNEAQGSEANQRFTVTPVFVHGHIKISLEEILAVQGEAEMFDVVEKYTKTHIEEFRRRLARMAVGNGFGALAQTTQLSATQITVDKSAINRFQIGNKLVVSATDHANVLRSGTARTITAVNTKTGVVTVPNLDTGGGVAGDFVFIFEERENSATPTARLPTGLSGWVQGPDATGTLFGVTVTGDPNLTGLGYDGTGETVEEGLIGAVNAAFQQGVSFDKLAISVADWSTLTKGKSPQAIVNINVGKANIGFAGYTVFGANGRGIPVVADAYLLKGEGYGITTDEEWSPYFAYAGKSLINPVDQSGQVIVQAADGPYFMMRTFFRGNIVCRPSKHLRIQNLGL